MHKMLPPEKAQKILKEHGTIVTLEQAKGILEFLNLIAETSIEAYINGHVKNPSIHRTDTVGSKSNQIKKKLKKQR